MIKSIYFRSFLIAFLIFLSGIMFGIWLDNYRLASIRQSLLSESIFWDDSLMLTRFSSLYGENFCENALRANLLYNEKIYERGREIEEAIRANQFAPELKEELRRYNLMKAQFWFNVIELKKKCNFTYHTVVHLQQFYPKELNQISANRAQANIMLKLKEKCGNKIMLIPLSVDLNLTTVEAIVNHYNIIQVPSVIIDEEKVFQGLTSFETLQKNVGC